jgi:zinc protease
MLSSHRRLARLLFALILPAILLGGCASFGGGKPWLYKGSDVPVDKEWLFGTLPNGLRYAIRRNGAPPGQVSVRVRVDVGSLMETDAERGYAHFIEHLSFRGSTFVRDGEAKRTWQRLGATFGSDSNAATTATGTVYKLDLPAATRSGLRESLNILAGMMSGPIIDKATVDSERQIVMDEARERFGPAVRVDDVTRGLFFAGQPLADRSPIGTTESLTNATADALRAFHDRWYRPDSTVVVIAGDGDPRVFEQMVKSAFAGWKAKGAKPKLPDFGRPVAGGRVSAVVVEPSLPSMVTIATLRPWLKHEDTIAYNQRLMRDIVATRLINRRLETRARLGGSFLQAQVDRDDVSRSGDATFVGVVPLGDDWQHAVHDVRAVIAEAMIRPASQAEIDREVGEIDAAMASAAAQAASARGSKLADDLVDAVDIRETVTSPKAALDIFRAMKSSFTPETILESTRRQFTGVETRAVLLTPKADPEAEARLAALLAEDVSKDAKATAEQAPIGFDRLPRLGAPGSVVRRDPVDARGVNFLELSNGVRLVLFPSVAEIGKVMVVARFGNGLLGLPTDRPTLAWSGNAGMVASGIGDLGQEELDRLTSGRQVNMGFSTDEDAFELRGVTTAADLKDQLTLLAAKLQAPGWDPNPIVRARAAILAGYDSANASPLSVIGRDLPAILRGGDPRWQPPSRAAIEALTPQAFRAFWEPLLKTGPIEVLVFGDFQLPDAIIAATETFGALSPRARTPIDPAARHPSFPAHNAAPLVAHHTGPADQAGAVIAWPTAGGLKDIYESRKLDVLATIFSDRLFERFRQAEGGSYSPSVSSVWPRDLDSGGYIVAGTGLRPDRVDAFFKLANEIAADLAARPVDADELSRAVGPLLQYFVRASNSNAFGIDRYSGTSFDRSRAASIDTVPVDLRRMTPADIQATARKWLLPDKSWSMVVLPEKAAGDGAAPKP